MKFKYKLLLGLILLMYGLTLVNAYSTNQFNNSLTTESITFQSAPYTLCYQESADIYNQKGTDGTCGLQPTGEYSFTGSYWVYSTDNFIDGDYSTYSYETAVSDNSTFNINYSKSTGSTSAIWRIKDGASDRNIAITSDCFSNYANTISLRVLFYNQVTNPFTAYINYQCYNGTWKTLSTTTGQLSFYDEGIYWNGTTILPVIRYLSIPSNISILTNTYLNLSGLTNIISYDTYSDNSVNWTKWSNTSVIGGTGSTTITESGGKIRATATAPTGAGNTASVYLNTTLLPTYNTISSLKVRIVSGIPIPVAYGGFWVFGNLIYGGATISDDSIWTINSTNFTNYDVWNDGVYNKTITPINSQLAIYSNNTGASGARGTDMDIYIINYTTTLSNVALTIGNAGDDYEILVEPLTLDYETTIPIYASVINSRLNSNYLVGNNYIIPFAFSSDTLGVLNYSNLVFNDSYVLSLCNSVNNVTYLNFTFQDAINNSVQNATITAFNISYYITGFPYTAQTYGFTSSIANISYPLCVSPSSVNVTGTYTISYKNSAKGYNGINTFSDTLDLTKTITTKILYMSDVARLVTFQIINSFSQYVNNAYISIVNYYSNSSSIVASGYTDSGGIFSSYLDNVTTYQIFISKSGYDNFNQLQVCSDTFYTITLSGLGLNVTIPNDYSNVVYRTTPLANYLNNNTYYNFSLTLSSTTWTFDSFGFNLTDSDGNLIDTKTSTSSSGGTISTNVSTQNFNKVIMNYYFTINGTTTNLNKEWLIIDLSKNSYSIQHLIDDFVLYLSSGLYGLTSRGLSFIVFGIIFLSVGILSFKYGIDNPVAICGVIFCLVYLFDVLLNWIPSPVSAVPHLATFIILVVFAGMIFKEVSNG